AATAAVQGLAGGDFKAALAGASAPYLAELIHKNTTTTGPDGKEVVNTAANLMAHAVVGAVIAQAQGNSALSGASGAALGEFIAQEMYPGIARTDLSEEQKQTISALGTLAAGLAGGLADGSASGAIAGAQAGKNAVENNALGDDDEELPWEHGNRPVKIIPINPMKTGIVDDSGNVLASGGKVITINKGQQNKHIPGTNEYKTAAASSGSQRSILTADPKSLLPQLGTGQQVGKVVVGLAGSKERIDFGKAIGTFVDKDTGLSVPTTKGIVHYGKDGAHIVPARP
ncbi:polymorphic toxin type 50 domain-containing protein, partial [Pantoea ananatis]|uniref:polymorphic toxin type 50 domain-containing protein n=1 Tax=Pantoea ananas TaxID=553 RepID=UPI003C1B765B